MTHILASVTPPSGEGVQSLSTRLHRPVTINLGLCLGL
jgi:hypothetical protein